MSEEIVPLALSKPEIELVCMMLKEAPYKLAHPVLANIGAQIDLYNAHNAKEKTDAV